MTAPATPLPAVYPVAKPEAGYSDDRFSFGLLIDVAALLEEHGYPPVKAGPDLAALSSALFTFIYRGTE